MLQPVITLLGIIIAAFYSRKQYRKTRIVRSELETYTFEKEHFERFKNLTITLNGTEVSNNLTFIKGLPFIVGQNDIQISPDEVAITIVGDDDMIVKDFKIIQSSHKFDVMIDGNAVNISMKNLKIDDFILYEIVCENLKLSLNVQSRVLNALHPFKINYGRLKGIRNDIGSALFFGIALFIFTFWRGVNISRYDFDTHYYVKGKEMELRTIQESEIYYYLGYNKGINVSQGIVNRFVKDTSKVDKMISLVESGVNLMRINEDSIYRSVKDYETKSCTIIDSLIAHENNLLFFVSRNYQKQHIIDSGITVSFSYRLDFNNIYTFFIFFVSLYFLGRAVVFIVDYFKYIHPLKKLLKRENIEA